MHKTTRSLTLALAFVPMSAFSQSPSADLAASVDDGFTIAAVGDIIIAHPLTHFTDDPGFAEVVELIRGADIATGNLETQIIDGRDFRGSGGGGRHGAEPRSAEFLRDMGFDILARANNHATDYGAEGLEETSRHLERAGLQHAGYGSSYWSARAARFHAVPAGRVGMVSATVGSRRAAMDRRGEWTGRGGLSSLDVTQFFMVPPKDWNALQTMRDHFPNGTGFYARGANSEQRIDWMGTPFVRADHGDHAHYTYQMDEQEHRDIIASVSEGKMRSDFITVSFHSHDFHDAEGGYRGEGIPEAEHIDTNPSVADYLEDMARNAIDNGADLFQGTGVHVLRAVEIYNGKPIFYGLGEFIRQRDIGGLAGGGEPTRDDCDGCPFPVKYESIVPVMEYNGDTLVEVRLYPIELAYDAARMAHRGIPRLADRETGTRILTRLQELSEPYGTRITIEENVGYIRP
jgi:poly-gamma-glutamate synthesis protein (capsule biosynthesis protein)